MLEVTKTRTVAAMLVAAAIAAPSAAASPIDAVGRGQTHAGPAPVGQGAATPTAATRQSGFDWGDAGLGAAGMLSVLGLGAGAVVIGRRGRRGDATVG
jgi:hypothetical protein